MDEDTATRFISSLVKSIQALCNGYVDFSSSIEVVGHIHLNIDHSKKIDYVLTEEVSKSMAEDATLFSSHSYHSKPPQSIFGKDFEASKPNRRKTHQVPRIDDSECDSLIIGTAPNDIQPSSSHSEGDFQTENWSSRQNTVLSKKQERQQASSMHTKLSPDNRKRSTEPIPLYKTLVPAAECSRDSVPDAGSAIQKADLDVIRIKDEPLDDQASNQAGGQDIQTPDFSNVVMESVDPVDQIEGTQFVAAGNMMQMQHQQPFPVMLHASPVVSLSGIPVSGFHDSGPSTESQSAPSTSGETVAGRRVRKPTAKAVQTSYNFKTCRTKATKKRLKHTASAAARKKSDEVGFASVSRSSKMSRGKVKIKASMQRLKKNYQHKSGYRAYTDEDVLEAIELIHGGVPVIDAALKYGIPRATLFNRSRDGCKTHTGRCSEVFSRTHGGQPSLKKRPKHMQYTKEAVEKAIEAVHAGMPVIDASILYHIPRATLFIRSAKGCPTHPGRCATVFSHGKLRRTKAPKDKYMALHKQASKIHGNDGEDSGSLEILQGVPVVNPVTGEVITFKTESEDKELVDLDNSESASIKGADLTQVVGSETRSDSEAQGIQPSTIVVKIERLSDTEN